MVCSVCRGVPCCDSRAPLPGIEPGALVNTSPAAIWLSTRSIKRLSSLSWCALRSPLNPLPALGATVFSGSEQLMAQARWRSLHKKLRLATTLLTMP